MEIDQVTKWLIRLASAVIIFYGLIIILFLPIVALTLGSKVSLAQESIKDIVVFLLNQLASSI